MKKYKNCFNILLSCIFLFSIVAFALSISPCANQFEQYRICKANMDAYIGDDYYISYMNAFLSRAIQCIFIAIFSALSAIASAVIAVIYNLPLIKAKKQATSKELEKD